MSLGAPRRPGSCGPQTPILECPFFGLSLMGPLSVSSYLWGNFHHLLPRVLPSSGNRFWWRERGLDRWVSRGYVGRETCGGPRDQDRYLRPQLLGEGPVLPAPNTSFPSIWHPALALPPAFSLRLCSHLSKEGPLPASILWSRENPCAAVGD